MLSTAEKTSSVILCTSPEIVVRDCISCCIKSEFEFISIELSLKNWQQNLDKKINFFVTFHAQIPEALYGETYPSELWGLSLL